MGGLRRQDGASSQSALGEYTMLDIPPAIEVYPAHHLPIIKAYADQLGLVGLINHYVPTAMDVDAGTVVLGLV